MKGEHEKQKDKDRLSSFMQKAECLLTKRNQRILFLLTPAASAGAVFDAVNDFLPGPISIALYTLAAAGLVMTCTLWVKAVSALFTSMVLSLAQRNRIVAALVTSNRLRAPG